MTPGGRIKRQLSDLKRWTNDWIVFWLLLSLLALAGCGFQENQSGTLNELDSITALTTTDIWAVGFASTGQGARPLVEQWNGRTWGTVPTPDVGKISALSGVAALTATDVWAVGRIDQGRAGYTTLIENWDGHAWKVIPSPNSPGSNDLRGVAVVSASDVWAVGETIPCYSPPALAASQQSNALARVRLAGSGSACEESPPPPPQPLIEHWDGSAWSIVPSPPLDPNTNQALLNKVVAFAPDNIWAAGFILTNHATTPGGGLLVEHWEGTAWQVVTGFDHGLRAETLAFLSSTNIWGVKDNSSSQKGYPPPTIQHWNGSVWSVVADPQKVSAPNYGIETLAASGPNDVWAIGGYYYSSSLPSPADHVFTMHWDGSVWRQVPCPSADGAGGDITASASLAPNDAWLVGEYSQSSSVQLIFMKHWDGHAWRVVPIPNPGT